MTSIAECEPEWAGAKKLALAFWSQTGHYTISWDHLQFHHFCAALNHAFYKGELYFLITAKESDWQLMIDNWMTIEWMTIAWTNRMCWWAVPIGCSVAKKKILMIIKFKKSSCWLTHIMHRPLGRVPSWEDGQSIPGCESAELIENVHTELWEIYGTTKTILTV